MTLDAYKAMEPITAATIVTYAIRAAIDAAIDAAIRDAINDA